VIVWMMAQRRLVCKRDRISCCRRDRLSLTLLGLFWAESSGLLRHSNDASRLLAGSFPANRDPPHGGSAFASRKLCSKAT